MRRALAVTIPALLSAPSVLATRPPRTSRSRARRSPPLTRHTCALRSGNVMIETAFYDDELLVCKMVLRVFYDQ